MSSLPIRRTGIDTLASLGDAVDALVGQFLLDPLEVPRLAAGRFSRDVVLHDGDVVPILEPEVSITSPHKEQAETLLRDALRKRLEALPEDAAVRPRVTPRVCPRRARGVVGRTTMSTSCPRAFRNRVNRSTEKPLKCPCNSALTFGWSIPSALAACAWVRPRCSTMRLICSTSPALTSNSSASGSQRSANTFPDPTVWGGSRLMIPFLPGL